MEVAFKEETDDDDSLAPPAPNSDDIAFKTETDDEEDSSDLDSLALKTQGDAAVSRRDWVAARTSYQEALGCIENAMDDDESPSLAAKIHANLALVLLKQKIYDESLAHGRWATTAAPTWGKAYARRGAAEEANGMLLDAALSYKMAVSTEHSFSEGAAMLRKLEQTRRYCKLQAIREFQQQDCYAHYLEKEANSTKNALAAMDAEQKKLLRDIRAGRVLPKGSSEELLAKQDLILYLAALDAAFHKSFDYKVVQAENRSGHHYIGPGMHQYLHHHSCALALESPANQLVQPGNVDVYNILLNAREKGHSGYEHGWESCYKQMSLILLYPNRDFEDAEKNPITGLRMWGPTLAFKVYQDLDLRLEAEFLVSLNYFILVRAETDMFKWGWKADVPAKNDPALRWDVDRQALIRAEGIDVKWITGFKLVSEQMMNFCDDEITWIREMFIEFNPDLFPGMEKID
ncbi:hypothetical protein ACHAXT_005022 [Thalassiosira profunda]